MTLGLSRGLISGGAAVALLSIVVCTTALGEANMETSAVRDLMHIGEYAEAMETAGFAQPASERWPGMQQIAESQRNILAQHTLEETLNPRQDSSAPGHEA